MAFKWKWLVINWSKIGKPIGLENTLSNTTGTFL